jgi:hypothetical protein
MGTSETGPRLRLRTAFRVAKDGVIASFAIACARAGFVGC